MGADCSQDCRDFGGGQTSPCPLVDPLATLASNGMSADRRFLANKMLPDPGSRCSALSQPWCCVVLECSRCRCPPPPQCDTTRAPHRGCISQRLFSQPRAARRRCHRVLGPRRGRAGVWSSSDGRNSASVDERLGIYPLSPPQGPRGRWVLGNTEIQPKARFSWASDLLLLFTSSFLTSCEGIVSAREEGLDPDQSLC